MRIIVLSGSPLALPALKHLFNFNYLSALICPEDIIASEIKPLQTWAASEDLPCWQASQQTLENDLAELIRETNPDLVLVFGFPYSLPIQLLEKVTHGGWNVHFSLQPGNQGTITIHQLAQGKGEQLLHQHSLTLLPEHEAGSPLQQLSLLTTALLHTSLKGIENMSKKNLLESYFRAVA